MIDGTAAVAADNGSRFAFPSATPGRRAARACSAPSAATASRIEKLPPGAKPSGGLNTVIGEVHTIENQGSYVKATLGLAGDGEEFVANVADERFFANLLDIGDRVLARWSASDINLLDSGRWRPPPA